MDQITNFLRLHLHDIAISMIATLLVMFGSDINRFIRQLVKKQHFLVRLGIFVLVCAIGYGVATLFLTDVLFKMLAAIPRQFLALSIVVIFILLGLTAETRKQI
jgi:hypothetical protein